MKNEIVNNAQLKTLSNEELVLTRGGIGILAAIVIGLAIAAGAEIFGDWDNFKAGLMGRPEI